MFEKIPCVHKKTGNVYCVLGEAINCTNALDGQRMIIYTNGDLIFVREQQEFLEKFDLMK